MIVASSLQGDGRVKSDPVCRAPGLAHSWGSAIVLASSGPAQFQEVFFGWKLLRMKECWREKAIRDKAEPASHVGG